jgi:DNA-binding ferritin-like protein
MRLGELFMGLAGHLRALQLFYHEKHHTAEGASFFSDHAAFGDFYAEAEGDFDSIVERAVGMGFIDTAFAKNHMKVVPTVLALDCPKEMESQLCEICTLICDHEACSEGTKQMVGDIADKSEVRQYKLGQRAK